MIKHLRAVQHVQSLFVLLILALSPLLAQAIPGATPAPAPTPPPDVSAPEPQPVPVSDIPERLRQAANIVRVANGRAAPLPEVKGLEGELPDLEKSIAELAQWTRGRLESETAKPELIGGLRLAWDANRQRLDAWQKLLKERSGALQQDHAADRKSVV